MLSTITTQLYKMRAKKENMKEEKKKKRKQEKRWTNLYVCAYGCEYVCAYVKFNYCFYFLLPPRLEAFGFLRPNPITSVPNILLPPNRSSVPVLPASGIKSGSNISNRPFLLLFCLALTYSR